MGGMSLVNSYRFGKPILAEIFRESFIGTHGTTIVGSGFDIGAGVWSALTRTYGSSTPEFKYSSNRGVMNSSSGTITAYVTAPLHLGHQTNIRVFDFRFKQSMNTGWSGGSRVTVYGCGIGGSSALATEIRVTAPGLSELVTVAAYTNYTAYENRITYDYENIRFYHNKILVKTYPYSSPLSGTEIYFSGAGYSGGGTVFDDAALFVNGFGPTEIFAENFLGTTGVTLAGTGFDIGEGVWSAVVQTYDDSGGALDIIHDGNRAGATSTAGVCGGYITAPLPANYQSDMYGFDLQWYAAMKDSWGGGWTGVNVYGCAVEAKQGDTSKVTVTAPGFSEDISQSWSSHSYYWHRMTYDGENIRFYFDGNLIKTHPYTAALSGTSITMNAINQSTPLSLHVGSISLYAHGFR